MKTIYVEIGYADGKAAVANYSKGKLVVWRKGTDGIFSELPPRPAKSMKDAMKQVGRIYCKDKVIC
ncbi:hypothetical protein [Neisseria iguanae]|uniref:Uncharacterized protein n=1 Tax=Neisseria iguanae TaxID=90242 RepID=A0A2P7TWU2_9NEIS|nr:hypothetical protein [Neisseria iguanae]PSJ79181.1 hypothetical protein C7N83_13820 [Neisseria iguanae]PSJ79190.1 hypothetical protein C7N83_13775 [Neisseria iguanae]